MITGTTLDMSCFDSVVFITNIGTANAGNYLTLQDGDVSTLTDAADVDGSKVIAATNGGVIALEIVKPKKRYIKPYVTRGASTTAGAVYAIQFNGKKNPQTNTRSGYVTEQHISPADGGTA